MVRSLVVRERYFVVADDGTLTENCRGEFSTTRAQDDESCAKMRGHLPREMRRLRYPKREQPTRWRF